MDTENKTFKKSGFSGFNFTVKGLGILLAFSFVASILAFSVAYFEHKNYQALVGKYDDALQKISECEVSLSILMNTTAVYEYPPVQVTEYTTEEASTAVTVSEYETAENDTAVYTTENTPTKQHTTAKEPATERDTTKKETTTKAPTTSGTYYVTQSGKKYHVSSCSYLSKSKIAITMDRIKAEGYSPCSRCIK